MLITESRLTAKRQVTLPIRVLQYIGLTPGDRVVFQEKNGHIEIAARAKFSIDELSKKYRVLTSKKATDEQIRKAREAVWTTGEEQ